MSTIFGLIGVMISFIAMCAFPASDWQPAVPQIIVEVPPALEMMGENPASPPAMAEAPPVVVMANAGQAAEQDAAEAPQAAEIMGEAPASPGQAPATDMEMPQESGDISQTAATQQPSESSASSSDTTSRSSSPAEQQADGAGTSIAGFSLTSVVRPPHLSERMETDTDTAIPDRISFTRMKYFHADDKTEVYGIFPIYENQKLCWICDQVSRKFIDVRNWPWEEVEEYYELRNAILLERHPEIKDRCIEDSEFLDQMPEKYRQGITEAEYHKIFNGE